MNDLKAIEQDPIKEDMEKLSHEDFVSKYCAEEIEEPCTDCEECNRDGACCLTCKHRLQCFTCKSEDIRKELDALPTEEFYSKIANHDEPLITFVAAERLRNAENKVLDLASTVVEIKSRVVTLEQAAFKAYKQFTVQNQQHVQEECVCNMCLAMKELRNILPGGAVVNSVK